MLTLRENLAFLRAKTRVVLSVFCKFRMMTDAPRADEFYNPPNEMEFKEWTRSMGRLTSNPDGWENFHFAIRRADGMVLFIENFKSLLHSQVQQAAQESGLVSASGNRTRTLPRPAQHSAHLSARPPLSMTTPSRRTPLTHNSDSPSRSPHRTGPWTTSATTSHRGGRPRGTLKITPSPISDSAHLQVEPHDPRQHLGREGEL